MQLPGRLSSSTLGDLLGALHRARACGALELVELRGVRGAGVPGRRHVVHLRRGFVVAIDTGVPVAPLGEILRREGLLQAAEVRQLLRRVAAGDVRRVGEILVADGRVAAWRVRAALRGQLRDKLERLFAVEEAELRFRPPRPASGRGEFGTALLPSEVLCGRRRARDGASAAAARRGRRPRPQSEAPSPSRVDRTAALAVLGLAQDASTDEIRRTFRHLATALHPDRHGPDAVGRFARVTAAYHALL